MALWAAHTPVGFAAAVYSGAQLLAAGMSWRWSFAGHAAVAVVIGLAVWAVFAFWLHGVLIGPPPFG